MERKSVVSSDIRSVGYDPTTQVLEIEFHGGGIYQYSDVPETVHRDLMNADSVGQYFHKCIKNSYRHRKV